MKLIDKSALVAEVERRKSQFMSQADNFHSLGMEEKRDHFAVLASNMHSILSFINTLEVKEVDLTEEDMKLVWNLGDEIPYMSEEEFFKELLRRYKAKKGENNG